MKIREREAETARHPPVSFGGSLVVGVAVGVAFFDSFFLSLSLDTRSVALRSATRRHSLDQPRHYLSS